MAHSVESFTETDRRTVTGGDELGDGAAKPLEWSYIFIRGTLTISVDPKAKHNEGILALDSVATDAEGRFRISTDVMIAAPLDPAKSNGTVLFDVVNRGLPLLWYVANNLPISGSDSNLPIGDAFIMRNGYTYVACGWQTDLRPRPSVLRITSLPKPIPYTSVDGVISPRVTRVMTEIDASTQFISLPGMPSIDCRNLSIASPGHIHPPPHGVAQPHARLFESSFYDGRDRIEIPREHWRFGRYTSATECVEDANYVCTYDSSGSVNVPRTFTKGKIYTLVYDAADVLPTGIGLAVLRDCALWLKRGSAVVPLPIAVPAASRVCAFGASQSGRLLRTMIHIDACVGGDGTDAFDGIGVWVAGASQGQFNLLGGQPSQAFPHLSPVQTPFTPMEATPLPSPLSDANSSKPVSQMDGLHARINARHSNTKVIYVNTSAEYHRGDASLLHVTPDGSRDVPLPPNARAYMLNGVPHTPSSSWPPSYADGLPGFRLQQTLTNAVDSRVLYRAQIHILHKWVSGLVDPPDSAIPSLSSSTLVDAGAVYAWFAAVPNACAPAAASVSRLWRRDFGVRANGTCAYLPPVDGSAYEGSLVPQIDRSTGNDIGGVCNPLISVPVATHTGWAMRHADFGGEVQLTMLTGSLFPLPVTKKAKEMTGDPRKPLEEMYGGDKELYLAKIKASADELVASRFILAEDADGFSNAAGRLWDFVVGHA